MKKTTKNFIYNFVGNILSKVLSFVVLMFTTRLFEAATFGEANVASSEYYYFAAFASLGVSSYGMYLITKNIKSKDNKKIINDVFTVTTTMGIIVSLVLFVCLLIFPGLHKFTLPYVILLITQALDLSWVFNAHQDMRPTAFKSFIMTMVNAVCVFLFYFLNFRNVYALVFANILATLATNIYLTMLAHKRYGIELKFTKPNFVEYLKKGFPYMASGLFAGINMNIDMVIMGYSIDPTQVAYYGADYRVVNELVALCAVIFTAYYPVFIEKIAKKEIGYMNETLGKIRTILLSAIVPCTIFGVIFGKELLGLAFGDEYQAGYVAFAILMIFVAILYYRELYGYTLTAAGRQADYMKITAISAGFNIVTNLIFIPIFGIAGAAGTTLVSEIINLLGMKYYVKKYTGIKMNQYRTDRLCLVLVILSVLMVIFKFVGVNYIVAIIIGCFVYVSLFILMGVLTKDELLKMLKHKEHTNEE